MTRNKRPPAEPLPQLPVAAPLSRLIGKRLSERDVVHVIHDADTRRAVGVTLRVAAGDLRREYEIAVRLERAYGPDERRPSKVLTVGGSGGAGAFEFFGATGPCNDIHGASFQIDSVGAIRSLAVALEQLAARVEVDELAHVHYAINQEQRARYQQQARDREELRRLRQRRPKATKARK